MQYLGPSERATLQAMLGEAGARATADAPLAWLYLEPETPDQIRRGTPFVVELAVWDGDRPRKRRLARAGAHGARVRWLG
jgi:hypothetical protein